MNGWMQLVGVCTISLNTLRSRRLHDNIATTTRKTLIWTHCLAPCEVWKLAFWFLMYYDRMMCIDLQFFFMQSVCMLCMLTWSFSNFKCLHILSLIFVETYSANLTEFLLYYVNIFEDKSVRMISVHLTEIFRNCSWLQVKKLGKSTF